MNTDIAGLSKDLAAIAVSYGLDVLGAIVLLVVGWIVAGWARKVVRSRLGRLQQVDDMVTTLFANLARYLVLTLVLIAVLAQFGIQTASILAVLGTIGLAIGLALQGTLSNIAAGLMLLFLRPFRNGDFIDAEGIAGTVVEVGLFATELTTFDGVYLVVPNSQIWTRSILNYSRRPTRRLDIVVGIAYQDDVEAALGALRELMAGDSRVLQDPAPEAMVKELADSSVNLNMRCWTATENYWGLLWDMNRGSREAVEKVGCSIPFPQRDLHIVESVPLGAASGG